MPPPMQSVASFVAPRVRQEERILDPHVEAGRVKLSGLPDLPEWIAERVSQAWLTCSFHMLEPTRSASHRSSPQSKPRAGPYGGIRRFRPASFSTIRSKQR